MVSGICYNGPTILVIKVCQHKNMISYICSQGHGRQGFCAHASTSWIDTAGGFLFLTVRFCFQNEVPICHKDFNEKNIQTMISKRWFISIICFTLLCPRWVGNGDCFLFLTTKDGNLPLNWQGGCENRSLSLLEVHVVGRCPKAYTLVLLLICSTYIGTEVVPCHGCNFVKLE